LNVAVFRLRRLRANIGSITTFCCWRQQRDKSRAPNSPPARHFKGLDRGNAALNLQLGKIYLAGHDPNLTARTWAEVMMELASRGKELLPIFLSSYFRRNWNRKDFEDMAGLES
jgi:hypothetical protein